MGGSDISEILRVLATLDGKLDDTRIAAAKTSTSVQNLEGWAESLDRKLDTERHERSLLAREVSELRAGQLNCPARQADAARRASEATGQVPTLSLERARELVSSIPPAARAKIALARWKVAGLIAGTTIPTIVAAWLAYVQIFGH